ncbi:hypothetical protein JCGZ_13852 [Jatropha curcas]|uniref:NAB domain-containing protein n=2 Tax=Jatropha curcas TaxID=180498 RepID=A0A067JVT6_JATCU|nr:hypothetical protein JCGZ_13852 [Jatropha curcas]
MEMTKKETSHRWWFDSHHSFRRSPWLQSTLGELDVKTKAMLKLIEEDADSFSQRAELFYKKRPELISMVEDFYRTYRSLAERYDQLKSDSANRLLTTLASPFYTKCLPQKSMESPFYTKCQPQKLMEEMDQSCDSSSETYDPEDSAESEVDDPELEDETELDAEMGEVVEPEVEEAEQKIETRVIEVSSAVSNEEMAKLQEEIERLKEENRVQRDQLFKKDEEKREVIRQLSVAVDVLKLENVELRKSVARDSPKTKRKSLFEFEKLKDIFAGKLFNGSSNSRGTLVAV